MSYWTRQHFCYANIVTLIFLPEIVILGDNMTQNNVTYFNTQGHNIREQYYLPEDDNINL